MLPGGIGVNALCERIVPMLAIFASPLILPTDLLRSVGTWAGKNNCRPRALGNHALTENPMSNRNAAKHKSNSSHRWALLNGFAHNNEPAYKRERRKGGGWWRCKNEQQLLRMAARQALKADRALGIIRPRSEYGL
jgi:hypothetical protein